ncbi:MAG: hypothetical protein HYT80_02705, partial [Euryarchaeota archaeon]|nr:hypothetical protein [Euryarchaeota archaeon]
MTARATPIATFLLLFGAALIASFGSLHAEAPCTDLKPAPDVTSDQTITQAVVWHCVEVHLKANVRITAGGKLRINESVVWIDPVGAATVTIQAEANGRLELNASALLPFADDRHAGRVLLLPDSSADINHTYFERLETFEVRTSAARINDTLVRDPASIGIHVRTASPRLENTTVEGGLTGIRVEGASTPTLRHVLVDGAVVQAVHVGSGVTALLDDVGLCAGDVGILLEGSATATMRRGEFCADLEQEARLLPSGTLAPKLALEGVPHTPARLVREGASRIDVGWFVEVEVFNATSPDASALTGARVLFRNATSHDLAPVLTDARHGAGPALVPDLAYGPQGTVQ